MIGPAPGVRVWLAAGATDMRQGFDGLSRLAQLGQCKMLSVCFRVQIRRN